MLWEADGVCYAGRGSLIELTPFVLCWVPLNLLRQDVSAIGYIKRAQLLSCRPQARMQQNLSFNSIILKTNFSFLYL